MSITPFSLNLRHLRATATIVASSSMSAAAEIVGLSQPALTQGLAKLERQLATRLFERWSGGARATAEGRILAERTEVAFGHLARAARGAGRNERGFSHPERLMTSTQLSAFLCLADAGSFVGASLATGLSQSALHRAVRDLEHIAAVVLVEKRGRGVALTVAGIRLARGVRLAAKEIAAALVEIRPTLAVGGNRIVIGAMPLSRANLLPHAIVALATSAPSVTLDIVEGGWRELVEPLRDGVIDLIIGALRPMPLAGLEQRPLFIDRLVVVGRTGHPLAATPAPSRAALAAFPWVIGRADSPLRLHWQTLFAGDTPPAAPIECGSVLTIRGILRDSDFLTLLSPAQIAFEMETGILTTIGPPLPQSVRTIGITTRTGWHPTSMQQLFLQLIEHAAETATVPDPRASCGPPLPPTA